MILVIIFIFLSGVWKAFQDTTAIESDYVRSIFHKYQRLAFYKNDSWVWKHKNGMPENGAAFFQSNGLFVFITDFWHYADFWRRTMMFCAIASAVLFQVGFWQVVFLIVILAGHFIVGVGFRLFYRNLLYRTHQNTFAQWVKVNITDKLIDLIVVQPFYKIWSWQVEKFNLDLWQQQKIKQDGTSN